MQQSPSQTEVGGREANYWFMISTKLNTRTDPIGTFTHKMNCDVNRTILDFDFASFLRKWPGHDDGNN